MPKPNSVFKLPKLLATYFLESSRFQAMGVLLQINRAQRVWNALLDPECKNLHEQCLKAENLSEESMWLPSYVQYSLCLCSTLAMPGDGRDGGWIMGDFTEQSESISKFSDFPAAQFA